MPKYTDPQLVESFLVSKVAFDNSEMGISDVELLQVISQAENKVELDLSPFYFVPFQGVDPQTGDFVEFLNIAAFPSGQYTVDIIKNLCFYCSISFILRFFYGKTGNNRGETYVSWAEDFYKGIFDKIKEKRGVGVFNLPPLPHLRVADNSQRISPVSPSPKVTGSANENSLLYVNKHVNDPRFDYRFRYGVRRGPR